MMRGVRCKSLVTRLIDYLFQRSIILSTLEELTADITALTNTIGAIDLKLDEVRAFIATLQPGVVTQEQLDQLAAMVGTAKTSAEAVLAEADALDSGAP